MANIFIISFALSLLAAMICFGLGAAICREAERSEEVWVLLALLGLLGGSYLLLGTADLLFGGVGTIGTREYYIATRVSFAFFFLAAGVGGHFLSLTLKRIGAGDRDVEVRYKAWAVFHLPRLHGTSRPMSYWRNLSHRGYLWMSYAISVFGIVVLGWVSIRALREYQGWAQALPKIQSTHVGGLFGAAIGGLVGLYGPLQLYIVVSIYQRLPDAARQFPRMGRIFDAIGRSMAAGIAQAPDCDSYIQRSASLDEWKAFLSIMVGTALGGALVILKSIASVQAKRGRLAWQWTEAADLAMMLLPLLILLPLVYYKMRFLFFDVLIKRGLLLAGLLAASAIWFFGALNPLRRLAGERVPGAEQMVLWVGVLAFASGWITVHRWGGAALDRYLFRRPDYGKLLIEIGGELRARIAADEAIALVADRLRQALGANDVRVADEAEAENAGARSVAAAIPVVAEGRRFGVLACGPRLRGQQYQSEDLRFLHAVADELAQTLRQFERRDEAEQQARREQELRELAARAELKALRAQINPHFLFNALNIAIDLTEDDPKLAGETLIHLAHVFRYALDATRRDMAFLGEELDFIRAYLEVERARFEEKLRFEIAVEEACRGARIPPMLIQPLVENAIKHGIAPKIGGGCVRIEAARVNGHVRVRIADDGAGFDPQRITSATGSGIGLANVRDRIAKLYGPDRWRLESAPGRGTNIEFEIGESEEGSRNE
ncbi:MAG: histidine kinase [Blastocatellia bacterium]|nr:histidine kinase [Blastocatellia bacterium]